MVLILPGHYDWQSRRETGINIYINICYLIHLFNYSAPLYLYFYSIFWHLDYPCLSLLSLYWTGEHWAWSTMHKAGIHLCYLLLDTRCLFCCIAYYLLLLIYCCIPYEFFLYSTWHIAVISMSYCFILHDLSVFSPCIRLIPNLHIID